MKSKSYNTTQKRAFGASKLALKELGCKIKISNSALGLIHANVEGSFLTYGHTLIVSIKKLNSEKVKIAIHSESKGPQLIDWGTNSEIETDFIELLSDFIL